MSFDYSGLATTAQNLIQNFGRSVVLRRASQTPADPARPWGAVQDDATATDDQAVTVSGVFVGATEDDEPPPEHGTERSSQLFVGPEADIPADLGPGWYVLDDTGARREIQSFEAVRPGGTTLLYKLRLGA